MIWYRPDDLMHSESWDSFLSPIGSALSQLPSLVLKKAGDCGKVLNGQHVVLEKRRITVVGFCMRARMNRINVS